MQFSEVHHTCMYNQLLSYEDAKCIIPSFIHYQSIFLLPENPNMPQNLEANQRNDTEFCVILIRWDPPANLAAENVSYYSVQVNESEPINENSTLTLYRACACASQSIRVSAVNFCKREGPSTRIQLDQNPTPLLNTSLQCESDAPTAQFTRPPCPDEGSNGEINHFKFVAMNL